MSSNEVMISASELAGMGRPAKAYSAATRVRVPSEICPIALWLRVVQSSPSIATSARTRRGARCAMTSRATAADSGRSLKV